MSQSFSPRNALLEGQLRGTFLIFLLQKAEANNVDMQSANENEEQLLLSDGRNGPQGNPATPPTDIEHEQRRVRRMNRHEREEGEMAQNRRREPPVRESPKRHRSGSRHRHHVDDRGDRRIQRDNVARHHEECFPLQRSELTCHITIIVYLFNLFRLLQNGATNADAWVT